MTDDELINAMCAAWNAAPLPPLGCSFVQSDIIAMRAVLAVVREHDAAELAAVRAERDASRAEAARLRAAFEWVMSWVDNWEPSFIYDEEWQGRVHEVRAALAQEGGR